MTADTLAEVLAEHGALGYDDIDGCECGATVRTHDAHTAHVAEAVRAFLADHVAKPEVVCGSNWVALKTRAERAEADLLVLREGIQELADELECPPHYREGDNEPLHRLNCHGCEKGARVRALLGESS